MAGDMKNKITVWAVVIAGLAALAVFAYWTQHRSTAPVAAGDVPKAAAAEAAKAPTRTDAAGGAASGGPIVVEAVKVGAAELTDDVQAVGSILANEAVVLRPEISGRIAQIRFREGQHVRRGDVLFELDDSVPRAELAQAEAQLALARSNYERTRDLAQQRFVSESAEDQAASALKVQDSARALAQTKLSKSTIRAPFDGALGVRAVAVGDYVKEGQDLVAIQDTATVKVEFRVPERYLGSVRAGQRVDIETDAIAQRKFAARVEFIDPKIDSNARSVMVRGRVANADGALRPGMFARVRLVFEQRARALTVPEEAIVLAAAGPGGSRNFVYRVVGEGDAARAVRTEVETGLRRDALVEIRKGLSAADRVVTAGQIKLRGDSVAVRVRAAPGAGAAPAVAASESRS